MHLTEDHLRSLTTYLHTLADDLEKKAEGTTTLLTPSNPEALPQDSIHDMRKLARQIEALSYNPILFESLLEEYDIKAGPLDEPLEQVPRYINEEDPVALAVVKWRLENAV
jgi:hypothetical protein